MTNPTPPLVRLGPGVGYHTDISPKDTSSAHLIVTVLVVVAAIATWMYPYLSAGSAIGVIATQIIRPNRPI